MKSRMRSQGHVRVKEGKLGSSARGGARAPGGVPSFRSAVGGEQTLSDRKLPGFDSQRAAKASGQKRSKRRMKASAEAMWEMSEQEARQSQYSDGSVGKALGKQT